MRGLAPQDTFLKRAASCAASRVMAAVAARRLKRYFGPVVAAVRVILATLRVRITLRMSIWRPLAPSDTIWASGNLNVVSKSSFLARRRIPATQRGSWIARDQINTLKMPNLSRRRKEKFRR